jgi:hypothetical protein
LQLIHTEVTKFNSQNLYVEKSVKYLKVSTKLTEEKKMFGILHLNSSCLGISDKNVTTSHMCGICNFLSARYGFEFRKLTNHDATFYSILCAAQSEEETSSQKCPLRFQKPKTVRSVGIEYASAISLLMAKTKIDDDLRDQNNLFSRFRAQRINRVFPLAINELTRLQFNLKYVQSQIKRQQMLEDQKCSVLSELTKPTENVVSEVFTHTATLTKTEENATPLSVLGRNVGKLMYLVDSYVDLQSDTAKGRFNALTNCYSNQITGINAKIKTLTAQSLIEISSSAKKLKLHKHSKIVNQALVSSLSQRLESMLSNSRSPLRQDNEFKVRLSFTLENLFPNKIGPYRCCSCEDPCGQNMC